MASVMVLRCYAAGMAQALRAWRVVALAWLLLGLLATPFAVGLYSIVEGSIGGSTVDSTLERRMDLNWLGEMQAEEGDSVAGFEPARLTRTAWLHTLEAWLRGDLFRERADLVAVGIVWALVWSFVLGGAIDRFARDLEGPLGSEFFRSGARGFWRLARLAAVSGIGFFAVYRLALWAAARQTEALRDVTVEGVALGRFALLAGATLVLLGAIRLLFDYAKLAAVVEDRPGPLSALGRGWRFVRKHPLRTAGLFTLLAATSGALPWLFLLLPTSIGSSGTGGLVASVLLGQLAVALRLAVRLSFAAAQLALYRRLS